MKYYVTYKIEAKYVVEVDANSSEEAREKATSEFFGADFGELNDIDGEDIIVENEDGDYVWER